MGILIPEVIKEIPDPLVEIIHTVPAQEAVEVQDVEVHTVAVVPAVVATEAREDHQEEALIPEVQEAEVHLVHQVQEALREEVVLAVHLLPDDKNYENSPLHLLCVYNLIEHFWPK